MFSQSKIEWLHAQWNHLPPHVQETITLLVDQCAILPDNSCKDVIHNNGLLTRSRRTRLSSLSRWLLKILRHSPEAANVTMDRSGWIPLIQITSSLPERLNGYSVLPHDYLAELIENTLGQRVQFNGENIRATYGHTTEQFDPVEALVPDAPLFHGTAWERWPLIQYTGLIPAGRRFVQLTTDFEYANRIARSRSSNPLVLQVRSLSALDAGVKFYNFGVHVWQCTTIPNYCLQQWSTQALPSDFWTDLAL